MNAEAAERSLFAIGDHWANRDQVVFGNLLFEFLLFSPSYDLARRHRAGTLPDSDRPSLPTDFEKVLAVYDDLGDVRHIAFDDWWLAKGIKFFGYQGNQPAVHPIDALLAETPDAAAQLITRATRYIEGRWDEQGRQPSLVIAIPLGLPKAQIMDQIEGLLAETPDDRRRLENRSAKYDIHGKKRDVDSLFRYIRCLLHKSYFPDLKLWEVGMLANLSTTYSERLAKGDGTPEDQQALKILTSRALYRGMMIAENAARGVFPSYDACADAITPAWIEVGDRLGDNRDWQDEQE